MSIDVGSTFRVFLKCVIRSKFKKNQSNKTAAPLHFLTGRCRTRPRPGCCPAAATASRPDGRRSAPTRPSRRRPCPWRTARWAVRRVAVPLGRPRSAAGDHRSGHRCHRRQSPGPASSLSAACRSLWKEGKKW